MNKILPGLSLASAEPSLSDGFTILPDGNFLINDGDFSPVFREYYSSGSNAGQQRLPANGGQVIDLSPYISPPNGLSPSATGVAIAPDGTLYFVAGGWYFGLVANTLIHWDLTQGELGEQALIGESFETDSIEDIDVVIP